MPRSWQFSICNWSLFKHGEMLCPRSSAALGMQVLGEEGRSGKFNRCIFNLKLSYFAGG